MTSASTIWGPITEQESERWALRQRMEDFLYAEADLLDRWDLHAWLDLFVEDCTYHVPTTDLPDGDPSRDLFMVQDDRFMLEQRVRSLLTRSAHAEYPHSRTRRFVSNVQASWTTSETIEVRANFLIVRMRSGSVDTYVGRYEHQLLVDAHGDVRFVHRRAVLDLEALRPHGKVSIIL